MPCLSRLVQNEIVPWSVILYAHLSFCPSAHLSVLLLFVAIHWYAMLYYRTIKKAH